MKNLSLLCQSLRKRASFFHAKSKCLQNYCKNCPSAVDGLHISMQNSEVYKLHSFSFQVYSFHPCCQFARKIKSNICTFLSLNSAICIFLFVRPFVIIIVYNGVCAEPPFHVEVFYIRRRTKMSKAISRRDFMKVTGAVGAAGLLAACGGNSAASSTAPASSAAPAASADESLALSDGPVSMTISWWGGDSRHEAYQNAIKEFEAEHSNITIEPTFAAWSGWEEKMAAAFIAGNAQDVCQVNWNWLYNYSADGSKFVDLNTVSKFLDLTQWDEAAMNACYVANSQQCVPVSMTGRIFYWNMTTFNKAGITEVPKTLDDLMAAGKAFQEKLGDDYYPMHLGAYDRMILMVFYLESKYGKDWADPDTSTLNYTEDEIAEGLNFIKSLVDGHVMMNLKDYYSANSDTATHQSNEWITGKIAGIFEWDSAATKYASALDDDNKDGFTVGEEIKFGDYNGGFSKVSMGLAITKTSQCVAEAATLIQFLLNDEKGASIMGSECGIPASKAGLQYAQAAGAVKDLVADANSKVMAFVTNKLDPLFENNDLKASGTGIYQEVFDSIDYGDETPESAVNALLDGMESVGYTIG